MIDIDHHLHRIYNHLGGTYLGMSVREFLDWVNSDCKTDPKYRSIILWASDQNWVKGNSWAEHQHSSISVSWPKILSDRLPHTPAAMLSNLQNCDHNKPSLPQRLLLAIFFVMTMRKLMQYLRGVISQSTYYRISHGLWRNKFDTPNF